MIPVEIGQKSGTNLTNGALHLLDCRFLKRESLNIIIHFIACSNNLTAMQMIHPLVNDLKRLEKGISVYDAFLQTRVLLVAPVLCALCDNVRASEMLYHLGSRAKFFCRKCMVILFFIIVVMTLLFYSNRRVQNILIPLASYEQSS